MSVRSFMVIEEWIGQPRYVACRVLALLVPTQYAAVAVSVRSGTTSNACTYHCAH